MRVFADKKISKVDIQNKSTDTGNNGRINMFTGSDYEQHPYRMEASGETNYIDLFYLYGARNEFRLSYDPTQATTEIP